jgi:hypothetical protein
MNTASGNPHASWAKRLLAVLLWALLAAVFGLCGWFFMLKPVATASGNWFTARDYQPVQATAIKQTGSDAEGTFTWYSARYDVGGKTYETSRLSVLDDEAIDEPTNAEVMKRLERAHAANQPTGIWVSPRKPEIAVVSRELPMTTPLVMRTLIGVGFAIFALAGVAGAIGALTGLGFYRSLFEAAPLWGFAAAWCGFIFPMLLLITKDGNFEWVAALIVGLFALVGVGVMWAAIAVSFGSPADAYTAGKISRPGRQKLDALDAKALATSYGSGKNKAQVAKGKVKRGGIGGRGGDFDKD